MAGSETLVCIDTETLIWGIQKRANPKERREIMVPKAEYFFSEYTEKNGLTLLIPTIVLGEYLVKVSDKDEDVLHAFLEKCRIAPYDYPASKIAAQIWSKKDPMKDELEGTRHCISADCKILAIAKAQGASAIYTDHSDIIKLARLINFPTRILPEVPPIQKNLF